MKYVITTQQFNDKGELIGTLTHTVNESETGKLTRELDCIQTFEGDFFDVVEGISSCEAALRIVGESC